MVEIGCKEYRDNHKKKKKKESFLSWKPNKVEVWTIQSLLTIFPDFFE